MDRASTARRSTTRLFGIYAAVTIVPVLILGVVLAITFRNDANRRGLAEGRSEAALIAQTAVEPELTARPLGAGLTSAENADMKRLVARAVGGHDVLRLRLRGLGGVVVFSDDGSGLGASGDDDEAVDAAHGEVVARLTRLNADGNDTGASGVVAVEVYLPLHAGSPAVWSACWRSICPTPPSPATSTAGCTACTSTSASAWRGLYVLLFAITASVSRRLRREAAINAFLAQHDTLTELPNRVQFLSRARTALARAERSGQPVAIAIVDLDRFKEINDTLGHSSGDRAPHRTGAPAQRHMRPGDTVARLGGDEFGLILCDVSDAEAGPGSPAQRDRRRGGGPRPATGGDGQHRLRAGHRGRTPTSTRCCSTPTSPCTWPRRTTPASCATTPAQDHYDAANLSLVGELRHAIDAGQLVLHYQPKSMIARDRIEAVEALVRWQHPTRGLLYPGPIPPAGRADRPDRPPDAHGSCAPRWPRSRSLREAGSDVTVAVNVSARSIGRADFAARVIGALAGCRRAG